jgi:transcriptional regulator with XRE-family HTH domain
MTVGDRLRQARKAAKMTGETLGAYISVSKGQISNIEKGSSDLTKGNAIVLSQVLGVSLEWLLNGEGNMFKGETKSEQYPNAEQDVIQVEKITQNRNDCERKLEVALKEIEHLNVRLKDKEQLIALLMKMQG